MPEAANNIENTQGFNFTNAVMKTACGPIIICDDDGIVGYFNPAAEEVFGYKADDVIGESITMLFHKKYQKTYPEFLADNSKQDKDNEDLEEARNFATQGGKKVKVFVRINRYSEDNDNYTIIAIKDVSTEARLLQQKNELEQNFTEILFAQSHYESQAAQVVDMAERLSVEKDLVEEGKKMIEYQACHDPLTELGNRMMLNDTLPLLIEKAEKKEIQLGVIYIDLDDFKKVNDSFGHRIGDEVLVKTARLIDETIDIEDYSIRLGGDEFGILVCMKPDENVKNIIEKAEKIKDALSFPVEKRGKTITVSGSLGIAVYGTDGTSIDTLLNAADKSMYIAKNAGKSQVAWDGK